MTVRNTQCTFVWTNVHCVFLILQKIFFTRARPRKLTERLVHPKAFRESQEGKCHRPLYVKQATEIACLFRDRGVTTHIHPYNTIRATLVRPKDKLSMEEQYGVVYQITCTNCPAAYVGEIERPLAMRLREHQHPGSPVNDHLVDHNHSFTKEDVVVITPREGLVPSRYGWVDPHCRRMPVIEPWSRSSHPPPDLQTAVVVTWP